MLELKPKEIQRARETFYTFDRDKSGTISEDESRRAFRHWFTFLHSGEYALTTSFPHSFHLDHSIDQFSGL